MIRTSAPSLERRAIRLATREVHDDGTFEGYASVFHSLDSYGDIVVPGAFAASLARHRSNGTRPKGLWQHSTYDPIVTWVDLAEDGKGLRAKGRLLLDIPRAREAHVLLRAGEVDGLSIGFECTGCSYTTMAEAERRYAIHVPIGMGPGFGGQSAGAPQIRVVEAVDLWEISLVTFPACAPARVDGVRAAQSPDLSGLLDALDARARAACVLVRAA